MLPIDSSIAAGNADTLYQAAIGMVLDHGSEVAPRGQLTREVLGATLTLTDARANIVTIPDRKLSYVFSVAEWLWMLLGRNDVASIAYFNKNIAAFSDDGVTFAGAYGPRFLEQVDYVVGCLTGDHDTRQAVLTFWRPSPGPSKDVPCTVSIQFFLRDGALHAHTYMRSNDLWLGFPYDLFNFTRLQAYVAARVAAQIDAPVPLGAYRHTVGSLHVYDRNRADARRVRYSPLTRTVRSPDLTVMPPFLLNVAFATVADPAKAEGLYAGWIDGADEPWSTYLGVLLYRTLKNRACLRAPYDTLIPEVQRG